MNTKPNNENDDQLRSVLREWKLNEPLPPRFREQVWSRIEGRAARESISLWQFIVNWTNHVVARPALAVASAVILLTLGLAGGFFRAQHDNAKLDSMMETRYVQSIDPYQK